METVQYLISLRDQLTPGLENADKAANKLETSLASAQGAANSLGAAFGIAFSIAGIVSAGNAVLSAGTMVEDATTGLTTSLQDSAEAAQVVLNTMQDAVKTPFAFEGLLNANRALISTGEDAEEARGHIMDLGNAIAGAGKGNVEFDRMVVNLQQIANLGEATAVDIKQFAIAGINIYKLLEDSTGKTVAQLKEVPVTYAELTKALHEAGLEGGIYENAMANMAGNTSVQLSNLSDEMFNLSVSVFNDLKPAITEIISDLHDFIGGLRGAWEWAVANQSLLKDIATTVAVAGAAYLTYRGILLGVSAAIKLATLWETIQIASLYTATGAAGGLGVGMTLLTAAQYAWNVAITANPIGLIIAGIAALVAGVIYAYNHFEKFRATLWAVWGTAKEFISILGDGFSALWKIIHGVFTLDASEIAKGFGDAARVTLTAGMRLAESFKEGWRDGMADFAADNAAGTKGLVPAAKTGGRVKSKPTVAPPETKTKATGSKNVTINVTIKDLIGTYNSNITNVKEASADIRAQVVAALTSAVNDFQIVAGE